MNAVTFRQRPGVPFSGFAREWSSNAFDKKPIVEIEMKLFDDQVAEWKTLDVPLTQRDDFDAFWAETLENVEAGSLNVKGGKVEYPLPGMEVRDLTYEGLDGTEVSTWLLLPPEAKKATVPCLVWYHGAGYYKGVPDHYSHWLMNGVAVIAIDFRLQAGKTGSNSGFPSGSLMNGAYTLGLLDRNTAYMYHLKTDALRALRLARETAEIDSRRIGVAGSSQGGGCALSMAALDLSVGVCLAQVPSNCWFEKRVFDCSGGAAGLGEYLRRHPDYLEKACETLSYFDNLNLADRIQCPTLVSMGLKDPVCTPDTIYAACNKITAPLRMDLYPFGTHDLGWENVREMEIRFLLDTLGVE